MTVPGGDDPHAIAGHAATGPAIVAGADTRIGRATAIALARAGHDVGVAWELDRPGAAATAAAVRAAGARAAVRRLHLADRPADAVHELAVELGSLWGFVACPHAAHRAGVLDESPDGWRRTLEVNLTGPFLCAQAAAQRLVAAGQGGRIVLVTPARTRAPVRFAAADAAAKAALATAARTMALELAPFGVAVHAVARGGEPDHVAAAIARLVSPLSGCRRPARTR